MNALPAWGRLAIAVGLIVVGCVARAVGLDVAAGGALVAGAWTALGAMR